MSIPFVDQEFTFTQPNGTELRVRGTGNQHQATFTLDGYTLIQDPASWRPGGPTPVPRASPGGHGVHDRG